MKMKNTELPNHCQECGAWGTNEIHLSTCSRRKISSTAEQIVRATLLRCQFDTLGDKVADVVKDLRANGLLSEGGDPSRQEVPLVYLGSEGGDPSRQEVPLVYLGSESGSTFAVTGENAGHWVEGSPTHIPIDEGAPSEAQWDFGSSCLWCDPDHRGPSYSEFKHGQRHALTAAGVAPQPVIDEAALTEVIGKVTDLWDEPLDEVHDIPQIARAVAAWLKDGAKR